MMRSAEPESELAGEDGPLPWLESADDIRPGDGAGGSLRFLLLAALALVAAVLVAGGAYWYSHRAAPPPPGDGSLILADREPYKTHPAAVPSPVTTDHPPLNESFRVSQGAPVAPPRPDASLAPAPVATAATAASAAPVAAPQPGAPASLVGVQVGAYSSPNLAETGWKTLVRANAVLNGLNHRVVEGQADIGRVYRLQALEGSMKDAEALCGQLRATGVKCQVKH